MGVKTYSNENRGVLFRDEQKDRETDRDYAGEIDIGGVAHWLSGWAKTSRKGVKFLSLSVKAKDAPIVSKGKPKASLRDELDDDLPF